MREHYPGAPAAAAQQREVMARDDRARAHWRRVAAVLLEDRKFTKTKKKKRDPR